jgi:hypothetical protein
MRGAIPSLPQYAFMASNKLLNVLAMLIIKYIELSLHNYLGNVVWKRKTKLRFCKLLPLVIFLMQVKIYNLTRRRDGITQSEEMDVPV